ncbi:uncharacterized protein PFLUO_LOCUS5797 [Penicillium psychrofluorescens]|uniref:uncharacterized protein n=1 Tax=Penicillium psychrofluorescens TaxID=3158075 RepID=UPI003CCCF737
MASYPNGPICTRDSLAADLRDVGLKGGEVVLLHSSLRSLGWVCGGAEAVVLALLDVLGPEGTLVVPSQTRYNSDPASWKNSPVPEVWWPIIRAHTPPFDPCTSRPEGMGAIAEAVRTWPGAVRSAHPQTSFAAVGPRAKSLMDYHPLDCRLGERSPLARLEDAGAQVLLVGVGFDSCTAFHLAEYRIPLKLTQHSFAITTSEGRKWITVEDVAIDGDHLEDLGRDFASHHMLACSAISTATTRLFPLAAAVAYAQKWLHERQ